MIFGVTWVAVVGLVVAVGNLVWNIAQGIRNRSRIAVGLDRRTFTIPSRPRVHRTYFTVTVQNLGNSPYAVWDVGLEVSERIGDISLRTGQSVLRNHSRSNPANIPDDQWKAINGPELPCIIPVGGVIDWLFDDDATKWVPSGTATYRGYASRFNRKGKHQRTQSKLTFPRLTGG